MKTSPLLVWVAVCSATVCGNAAASQTSSKSLLDVEQRLGPFRLAPGQDFFVVIHSKRLEMQPGKFDEAAAWLEIRDSTGGVQHHETFEYTVSAAGNGFDDQCSASAEMLDGSNGTGIAISSACLPSAPLSGGPWQIFGLVKGKLSPLGKPIYLEGELEGFVPGAITKQGTLTIISADMLKFKVFTGNLFVMVPLRVNWIEGRLEPGMRCFEQSGRGTVESGCEVPIAEVERVPIEQDMTFVRMFPESNGNMTPAHVVIKKTSKVEIVAAKVHASFHEDANSMGLAVDDDVWIKVRIDGKEGWIHTQEDFDAIGLPQSG